jgi:hypothetical protein
MHVYGTVEEVPKVTVGLFVLSPKSFKYAAL